MIENGENGRILVHDPFANPETDTELAPPTERLARKPSNELLEAMFNQVSVVENAFMMAATQSSTITPGLQEAQKAIDLLSEIRDRLEESTGPRVHHLECDPEPFALVKAGHKKHEVREFDRDYRVGDVLVLREFDRSSRHYTGDSARVRVTAVTAPGTYGLPAGIGVMSVEPI